MTGHEYDEQGEEQKESEIATPGRFTEKEVQLLVKDGARIYKIDGGNTINFQLFAQRDGGRLGF